MEFLLGKVRKQLSHWVNKSLSFVGQMILLRHIIRAMSVYHFMSISLSTKGYKMLEEISGNFMWGKSTRDRPKKALVA